MRQLFVTPLYEAELDIDLAELAHSIHSLAEDDAAGRRWAKENSYKGYTSYASLNDLPRRDPVFGVLSRTLTRHAAAFARELAWEARPRLDSAHIHPHSILSGTLYVDVPEGSGAIRFEDPRLPMMMAAPRRLAEAPEQLQPFVQIEPRPGQLLLWESWLRHEVLPGTGRAERLSVSFNFA
jgi:hypothetical protein